MLFEQDWVKVLADQQTRFLRSQAESLGLKPAVAGKEVKLLDYACGSGVASWVRNASSSRFDRLPFASHRTDNSTHHKTKQNKTKHQALLPYVTKIRGVDVAPAVVSLYNRAAAAQTLTADQAHAIEGDLSAAAAPADSALSSPDMYGFDIAIVSMALHHMDDPQAILTALASRLRKGGLLIVVEGTENRPAVDKMEAAGLDGPALRQMLNVEAFAEETMRDWLRAAGCRCMCTGEDGEGFVYVVHDEISPVPESACKVPGGLDRQLLIAASVKA
ncbi:hypothetical protein SODALDRAFT_176180 [Sodiomyces alkalinus F11]|uniref:S-adenosyl-L-methionine-dependent methyltransferase n=1 Tax=Sodiomyces alkalinus (strain CBS 110278 / VKM F-3762 / F11) TaxID=1314773 RepID=A0A3N2PTN4_SODAK|nr:hypothetical protein SODALDRAFT_176180 [Sodiomyces alkalinus F11]ROT37879.1 hypothetical protein SODALDRAFT_176180 [Sodiomyces alkalinus F11]